jgi:hypothetical protein
MLQNLLYPCKVKTIKMKALLILACSLLTVGAMAQTTEPAKEKKEKKEKIAKVKKPPIEFKTLVIEKNDIPYGEDVVFEFEFKNNGKEPVIITDVRASCGCTTPTKPTEPVKKGKSDKIIAKYDTKRIGAFTKTITVTTNVSTEPIVLTIKGTVLPQKTEGEEGHEGHNH